MVNQGEPQIARYIHSCQLTLTGWFKIARVNARGQNWGQTMSNLQWKVSIMETTRFGMNKIFSIVYTM